MAPKKNRSLAVYKVVSIFAIVIALIALAKPYLSAEQVATKLLPIDDLSTSGYTKVDVAVSSSNGNGAVVLQGGCYQLTANTEMSQVESISNGQEGKITGRPSVHDVFKDALQDFDISVIMVKIVDIQDNNYIGRLILKQDDKILSLDSRPSDGIALAVRTNAPIYIKEDILKSQGTSVC